jgi:PAS domain S-box-containing protein
VAGLGIISMIMIAPSPGNYSYYAGLILVFIYGYTFFKLRFIYATFAAWLIIIAYEIAAMWVSQTPTPVLLNNNFFFLSANIIGMFACYSIEYYSRKEFMQARLLEAEKKKVKAVNRELEKRVKDRTAQLVSANEYLKQEIEDRNRAEEALREGEEKYRTIIEGIEEGYFELDLSGNMTFFNDSMCKILGFPRNELVGMNNRDYTSAETAKKMYDAFNKIYRTGNPEKIMDFEIIKKDGATGIIEISASLRQDASGEPIGFRGVARDVTERKLIEAELIQTKNFLQNILDSSLDGITTTDLRGTTIYTTPRVKDILGYEQKELMGEHISKLYVNGKEDAKVLMRELMEKGELNDHEMELIRKGGGTMDVSVSASLLRDEKGEVVGTLGIYRDISEKKRLESQLRQAQKLEAIGTLAGGIAHDFNNVLSAVIGYADLARADTAEGSLAQCNLGEVLTAANRAKDLVRQILTFSRQDEQELKPVKVSPIVKEALKFLRASTPSTIEIRQTIQSTNDIVLSDPTKIHQVLMNLGTNAAHAMFKNGGVLEVNLTDVDVDPSDLPHHPELTPGPYLKLTVSDTGEGMDRALLERIFDPYFTTKEKGKGTGLGLSVVLGIVKSHKGSIIAYSEPGNGTTFNVYLPRLEKSVTQVKETKEPLPGGDERILFVDDEESLVKMGKQMLERLGYEVITKTNGSEALEDFRSDPDHYDLVITDMTMPGLTGMELAKELMAIRPGISIILCTGFSHLITEEKAKAAGIQEFVMKPLVMADLARTCRKVLDNRQSRSLLKSRAGLVF